ncbi:MAG: M20 family metallopeptidase [Lawsonibacter sp.]|jgi:acetylornithine deacetylase/succinyl-diaminopimelate desuccinylase-like protein|nr:M20 family metallopeptidase [Lawsonibacter sp.]
MTELEQCIDLLRQMVAIPSESGNEAAFASFLERFLREELKLNTHLQHVDGNSCNVIGQWNDRKPRSRKLILGGHIDTVPPTPRWRSDPYQLLERDGTLCGLGAADMKGGLAAQLMVLKRLKDEAVQLDADIEFVGLADEERYSIGAHAYVDWAKVHHVPGQKTFFIMGEPHYDDIVIGASGKALLSLQIRGEEGHAATPEKGTNAIDCMAAFLEAIQETYMPKYMSGTCASYCCLSIDSGRAGYSLTIPATCQCLLNKQLLPTERIDSFIAELETLYAKKVGRGTLTIQKEIPSYPAYQIDPEQEDLNRLTSFLQTRFSHTPLLRINQSVSDGNILYNNLGIPTALFGPKGVAFHTEHEHVAIGSIQTYMDALYGYICEEYGRCIWTH